MKVVAIVPAYNEAPFIADVVRGAAVHVEGVVVVDDGSSDATAGVARAAGATVLSLPANQGKGSAVRRGLEYLLTTDATHALLMDGDMQHRPEEIPRLVDAARQSGAALVVGARVFRREAMPASRYWANVIGSWALSTLMGVRVKDTQSGFRLLSLDAVRHLGLCGRGYEIETEMIVKLARRGATVVGVPVSAVYNESRSKLRPVRDTTRNVLLAIFYRFAPARR
jgi:glycosyltransferase involved in cell wall biosynthesis